jgi:hypothetical protein
MGDITSGGVKDDAAANMDFGGGGGQDDYYSASQNIPTSTPSTPVSLGFGGAKGDIVARTPTSVPTVSPPMSPFQLGFGGAQKVPNYMDDLNTLMGGGGSSADASSVSVSVSDQPSSVLGVPDFVAIGGGTSKPDTRPRPDPDEITKSGRPDFVFDYMPGFTPQTITDQPPISFDDTSTSLPIVSQPLAKPSFVDQQPQVTAAQADAAQKQFDALTSLKNPKTDQDFSFLGFVGNIFKGLGSGAKSLGDFISNLSASDAFKLFNDFLIGDPNFKGTPSSEIDPFAATPGPGPEVGGGVPSPSGTGTDMPVTTMPDTPAETVIKKDPCPPGFKLDPILNQCMPIVKSAPTPPPMPTLPQPTAPTGGGIANVYPFTLTPPVGAPVGTVAPIRFTPK